MLPDCKEPAPESVINQIQNESTISRLGRMNTSRLETIEQKYIDMAKTIQTVKQNPKNSRKRKKINIGGPKEKKRGFHRVSIWVHNNATLASLAAKIVFFLN